MGGTNQVISAKCFDSPCMFILAQSSQGH